MLVSIQSLILVPEPYFNEPGYEQYRGSSYGNKRCIVYNGELYCNTMKWAIIEQIRNPDPCFKEVCSLLLCACVCIQGTCIRVHMWVCVGGGGAVLGQLITYYLQLSYSYILPRVHNIYMGYSPPYKYYELLILPIK